MIQENEIKVEVLLSAYNGERYIPEQIQSIIDQTFQGDIIIRIRDDGSPVGDLSKILDTIALPDNRRIEYFKEKNVGAQKSFLRLIQEAGQADYYFFADQDDVWKKEKIRAAVRIMNDMEAAYKLYCSNYSVVNGNLEMISESGVETDDKTFHFLRAIFYNTFPGCVMGFSRSLLEVFRKMDIQTCMMHDSIMFAAGIALGEVYYDETPMILHRIHGDNVVGYGFHKSTPLRWIKEKTELLIKKEDYDVSEFAKRLIEVAKKEIREEWRKDVVLLRDFKKNRRYTNYMLRHPDVKRKVDPWTLSIRNKIRFHLF